MAVRDANGALLPDIPMRVEWDGGFIDQPTDANGRYEFIPSPGQYDVRVNSGASQRAYFRTNLKQYYGHYTYQVDFVRGKCASGTEVGRLQKPARYNALNKKSPELSPVKYRTQLHH